MTLNLTNCPSEPAPYISATPRTLSRHKDDSVQLPLNLPLPHTFMRTFFFSFYFKIHPQLFNTKVEAAAFDLESAWVLREAQCYC